MEPPPPRSREHPERKYVPPSWATAPKYDFSLDVIRSGVVVDNIPLKEHDHFIMGRQPDVCDIPLDNPYLSRQHAVLQFGEQGELYIVDLGSVQGTKVNKKPIEGGKYVYLPVGSSFQLGASSKMYAVCGPEELMAPEEDASGKRQLLRQKSEARQLKLKIAKESAPKGKEDACSNGIDWGMGPEDQEEERSQQPSSTSRAYENKDLPDYLKKHKAPEEPQPQEDIHEKDQQLFEKLQQKRNRITKLQEENDRMKTKAFGVAGLSEGQKEHMDKNLQRIEKLEEEILDLENELHQRNSSRKPSGEDQKKNQIVDLGYESEGDEFYDRTKLQAGTRRMKQFTIRRSSSKGRSASTTGKASPSPAPSSHTKKSSQETSAPAAAPSGPAEVESLDSVQRKLKEIGRKLKEARLKFNNLASKSTTGAEEEEEDELEAFMSENTKNLEQDEQRHLDEEIQGLEASKARLLKVLSVVVPAGVDAETLAAKALEAGEQLVEVAEAEDTAVTKEPTGASEGSDGAATGTSGAEGHPNQGTASSGDPIDQPKEHEAASNGSTVEGMNKRRRVLGPTMPPSMGQ